MLQQVQRMRPFVVILFFQAVSYECLVWTYLRESRIVMEVREGVCATEHLETL